jgi:hypothetical protein
MGVVSANPFLPRVNVVPQSVMTFAVARGLQGIYAQLLREAVPDHFTSLMRQLDASPGTRA